MDVVAAALVRAGSVLAARRIDPPGWEFPGGKIEPGESPQQALVRECREELGIDVDCGARLGVVRNDPIRLQLWQVALRDGTPTALADHDAVEWVDRATLATLDWLPLDRALLEVVHRALTGPGTVDQMRAVVVTEPGDPEVLRVEDVPDPVPGPGEVLIKVAATAVNRADCMQRQGNYPPPRGAPEYLGLECSGTIAALGDDVAGWEIGAEVCALLAGGGYAEYVAVPVGQLMPVPHGISLVDAAALPEVSCTVWSMVFGAEAGRLQPGERLLVHGGTSGIGTMAIQLATQRGAQVFATAGTDRKVQFCRELGAAVAINYREDKFEERVRDETDGGGVDVILDNMGASYLERNVASLALGGRLVVLGLQGGRKGELDLGALLTKRATVHAAGLRARPAADKAMIVAETVLAVWPLIESGAVRPVIDRILTLDDVVEAHRLVESSEHIGKVILRVS